MLNVFWAVKRSAWEGFAGDVRPPESACISPQKRGYEQCCCPWASPPCAGPAGTPRWEGPAAPVCQTTGLCLLAWPNTADLEHGRV